MDIQLFNFDDYTPIRTAYSENGEPLVCAADLARELGLKQPQTAYARLDDDFKVTVVSTNTLGGNQDMTFLTEAGVYDLMMGTRLRRENPYYDRIKAFRKWVCSEILPTIRKTGTYTTVPAINQAEVIPEISIQVSDFGLAKKMASLFDLEGNQALLFANKVFKKVHNFDVIQTYQLALPSPDNEKLFTPTEIGTMLTPVISAIKVNKIFEAAGFQANINRCWVLTDNGKEYGTYLDTGKKYGDGTPVQQIKWKESVLSIITA